MSKDMNEELENPDDVDMELFQFDSESYGFPDFNTAIDSQETEVAKTQVDPLGELEQQVIDEHESFLSTLTQMVEHEREYVDCLYKNHEPVVHLNQELKKELAIMKEKIDHATQILAKMQALFEQ